MAARPWLADLLLLLLHDLVSLLLLAVHLQSCSNLDCLCTMQALINRIVDKAEGTTAQGQKSDDGSDDDDS